MTNSTEPAASVDVYICPTCEAVLAATDASVPDCPRCATGAADTTYCQLRHGVQHQASRPCGPACLADEETR